ncbi:hypothetical protein KR222_000418 [Zaprionus bogoriensis]|nr:hypothetical protein KR222_000418 [Zaprionus bogoriensis]
MQPNDARTPQAQKNRYVANITRCRVVTSGRRYSNSNNNNSNSPTSDGASTSAAAAAAVAAAEAAAEEMYSNGANENQMPNPNPPQNSMQSYGGTVCTPPPKRLQKVRNPFEGAMAERLHLPLIASPSLFQCKSGTPQLSSTQFEWDIEEVSQLKPADVEPHETQFQDSPDPEQESKAQLAISNFFKESHIVPSPVDCPLRKQRIVLNELDENTPISNKSKPKPAERMRDCEVQTELTLPPVLPQALEDALRPYLQPHLAGPRVMPSGGDVFNTSMRRKLFDLQNVIVLEQQQQQEQPDAEMVGSSPQAKQTMFAGRLSDSASAESAAGSNNFGCLSPIRNLCGLNPGTPDDGNGFSARKRKQLLHEVVDMPSPIAPSEHLSQRRNNNNTNNNVTTASSMQLEEEQEQHDTLSELTGTGRTAFNFTPDRSSSPRPLESSADGSINRRVGRMRVDSEPESPECMTLLEMVEQALINQFGPDVDFGSDSELEADDEAEDDSQVSSQLSASSFNCSSSNSDTPRVHRRRYSLNRKNLSESFRANLLDESEPEEEEQQQQQPVTRQQQPQPEQDWLSLYRTDSGYNDGSSNASNFACSQELQSLDVSMACSTPSSTRS